jgi:hypothetical protein
MSKSVDQNQVVQNQVVQNQVVQNPLHDVSHEEITLDIIDPSDVANVTDNTIRNVEKINKAMRFSSENAASAFADISGILNGGGTNEEKKAQIAEKSKDVQDTTLQVFANMAIGMLGSSKEVVADEKEVAGIEKLSKAFAFLGHKIDDDTDELAKDKRCQDMALAYAGLMTDTEIDEDTKKSIETAFKETPDIAKIAQIQAQEGEENKGPEELKMNEDISDDSLKDPSTYDGKNWEDFKSKAIYGTKGAIAIGLLFAPGGIFLAPLFLYATKNFGRNPEQADEEKQKAEEKESAVTLEFLNAYKKYLDPKGVEQNEVDEQGEKSGLVNKHPTDEATIVGEKAKEFVKKENGSLTGTQETLEANKEGLKRVEEVEEVEVKNTAVSVVDETTKAALASIIGGLVGTNMEENRKDETTGHGVTTPQVGGRVVRNT